MSSEIAIKVENLSKCYRIYTHPRDRLKQLILPRLQRMVGISPKQYFREFWALRDVSFEVKKGETLGIIGRNGSGKSTLMQILCGTLNLTGGSIQTHGRIAALLELGSGFNPEFTGRENVYMNAAVLGLSKEEVNKRFVDIEAFADIGQFIEQPVKTYSSGMMVRLAFAISVCVDPDILIVDEALAVGDALFQFKCLERLRHLSESGLTLIFVSHDVGMVQSFCKNAIHLQNGIIKNIGAPSQVAELYFLDIRDHQRMAKNGVALSNKTPAYGNSISTYQSEQGQISYAFFSENKGISGAFIAGEQVRLSIGYMYEKHLEGVSVSVILSNKNMLAISGRYFFLNPTELDGGSYSGRIEVAFDAILKPGLYFLTVRLEHSRIGNEFFPLDKQPNALSFDVTGNDAGFLGVVDVGMKIVADQLGFSK